MSVREHEPFSLVLFIYPGHSAAEKENLPSWASSYLHLSAHCISSLAYSVSLSSALTSLQKYTYICYENHHNLETSCICFSNRAYVFVLIWLCYINLLPVLLCVMLCAFICPNTMISIFINISIDLLFIGHGQLQHWSFLVC